MRGGCIRRLTFVLHVKGRGITRKPQGSFILLAQLFYFLSYCRFVTCLSLVNMSFSVRVNKALLLSLHRYRRGRGFESRSKPENFFQVFVSVVLRLYSHLIATDGHLLLLFTLSLINLFSTSAPTLVLEQRLSLGYVCM